MNPIVYSSTDAGAPIIYANDPESILNALEVCLTQGYGSKPAAGWTSHFRQTGTLVLRMASGSMRYIKIGPTTLLQTNIYAFPVRGYDDMTDINTGTGMFPDDATLSLSNPIATRGVWVGASTPDSTSAIKQDWDIIADDRFFYFRHMKLGDPLVNRTRATEYYFFGDTIPNDPTDNDATVIRIITAATTANSNAVYNGYNEPGTWQYSSPFRWGGTLIAPGLDYCQGMFVCKKYKKTTPTPIYWDNQLNALNSGGNYAWASLLSSGTAPFANQLPLFPNKTDNAIFLNEANYIEFDSAAPTRYQRGKLPGLYIPMSLRFCNTRDTFQGMPGTPLAGKTFFCWGDNNLSFSNAQSYSGPCVCFSMSDWRI